MTDVREEHIEQLKQAIIDAKKLHAELKQNIADMNKLVKAGKARRAKKPKAK